MNWWWSRQNFGSGVDRYVGDGIDINVGDGVGSGDE